MNIGILTYHFGTNFGGQLQCYALFKTLQKMGHNPIVVNYLPSQRTSCFIDDFRKSIRFLKSDRSLYGSFAIMLFSNSMRKAFSYFQKEKLVIGPECTLENFNYLYPNLDALVVGSDQVWAPAHHATGAYFFNFSPKFNGKKISYAPCCAINNVEDKYRASIKSLLDEFSSISVRNLETQAFVKDLVGQEVPIVADPTFLYDFCEFKSDKTPQGKYILTYILGEEILGGHETIISKIKREYGNIPVYSICLTSSKPHYFSWSDKTYWDLDPIDWVDFIRNASFLYTDSFHGVVFAMKLRTPFLAYYKEIIRASRFIDLKERYMLTNIINMPSELEGKQLKALQPGNETYAISESIMNESIEFIKEALL